MGPILAETDGPGGGGHLSRGTIYFVTYRSCVVCGIKMSAKSSSQMEVQGIIIAVTSPWLSSLYIATTITLAVTGTYCIYISCTFRRETLG